MLFLQEFVDSLEIVETVVDEETQFGHDSQLIVHACAQLVTNGLGVVLDVAEYLFAFFRGKYAEIGGADAEVGGDARSGYADHHAVHHAGLRLEDEAELFL